MHINDVIRGDIRLAPNRPRVQLQLEFEHRSAVLGVHFIASLLWLVISLLSLEYEVTMSLVKGASVPVQLGYLGNGRDQRRVSVLGRAGTAADRTGGQGRPRPKGEVPQADPRHGQGQGQGGGRV